MAFFVQLLSYWILLWIASCFIFKKQLHSHAKKGRIAFALSFIVVGVMHLLQPKALSYMIEEALSMAKGDQVMVVSKAFNPLIRKLE